MKKRILVILLALCLMLSLLPATAMAANGTGHRISVKIYKVVLDSTKPLGYQNPELITTTVVVCQDTTAHSGYNHFVNLKDFYPTNFGLSTTDWTGWQFNGYYEKGKDKATFYSWTRDQVNATANVTGSEPYPCSKNFYIVYRDAAQTYTLTYDANGGTGAPAPQTGSSATGSYTFNVSSVVPTNGTLHFMGWADDRTDTVADYQAGDPITLYAANPTKTIYAVWGDHTDADHDGYCDIGHECLHDHDENGYCTEPGCNHPHGDGDCCPLAPVPPEKPDGDALKDILSGEFVKVDCINDELPEAHDDKTYGLLDGGYEIGEVTGSEDVGYTCTVTLKPEVYLNRYNQDLGVQHVLEPKTQTGTIRLYNTPNTQGWVAETPYGVTFTVICETPTYTVTYTDGVEGEVIFENQSTDGLLYGDETPAFKGELTRKGYVFYGWTPAVKETVTGDAIYTATWELDTNGNGIADKDEEKYTVTYTDGVDGEEVFADQVTGNLLAGAQTPAFKGTPSREGYSFVGWEPEVAETVTGNAVYKAKWEKKATPVDPANPSKPTTGDSFNTVIWVSLLLVSCAGIMGTILCAKKKKHEK